MTLICFNCGKAPQSTLNIGPCVARTRADVWDFDRGGAVVTAVYTYADAQQNLATLLDQAADEGEVRGKHRDGQVFVIRPEVVKASPLDIEGIDLEGVIHDGQGSMYVLRVDSPAIRLGESSKIDASRLAEAHRSMSRLPGSRSKPPNWQWV